MVPGWGPLPAQDSIEGHPACLSTTLSLTAAEMTWAPSLTFFFFETESHHAAQAVLELSILLLQSLSTGYRRAPPQLNCTGSSESPGESQS
jgi:hypothetical protein